MLFEITEMNKYNSVHICKPFVTKFRATA